MRERVIPVQLQPRMHLSASLFARLFSLAILFVMVCAVVLLDAALPLQGLRFYDALLANLRSWPLLATYKLFPGQAIMLVIPGIRHVNPPPFVLSWRETVLLLNVFLLVFLVYLLALYYLPGRIQSRYLFSTTLLLGILYMLIPIVTSSDVFSYIAYARMGVIYHLNPLTAVPTAIHNDLVYRYVYWTDQPSAYGPTWAIITCFLQWLDNLTGTGGLLRMLLALRLVGLASHLGSTMLIWSIGGHLQRLTGSISYEKRMQASLAFAWNPLLLFEACVNAHNDVTILFFILLAVWFLVRSTGPINRAPTTRSLLLAVAMFALATCLKINIIILAPGLLLFLFLRQPRNIRSIVVVLATYLGIIILLYAPFWQHGAVLNVLRVSPAVSRTINTPYDVFTLLYIIIAHVQNGSNFEPISTPAEHLSHIVSLVLFAVLYAMLCWRFAERSEAGFNGRDPRRISTVPGLVRWMAAAWLIYCAVGSPWFWPWYLVTFFGLYALVDSISIRNKWGFFQLPLAVRLLTFSMLTLYCFDSWAPMHTFYPGLGELWWSAIRDLFIWAVPLLAIYWPLRLRLTVPPQVRRWLLLEREKVTALRG